MSLNILNCGVNVQDLAHLLAAAVVIDPDGEYRLRVNPVVNAPGTVDAAAKCGYPESPEEMLRKCFSVEGDNLILNLSIPTVPA
jgi:hypothetical protein